MGMSRAGVRPHSHIRAENQVRPFLTLTQIASKTALNSKLGDRRLAARGAHVRQLRVLHGDSVRRTAPCRAQEGRESPNTVRTRARVKVAEGAEGNSDAKVRGRSTSRPPRRKRPGRRVPRPGPAREPPPPPPRAPTGPMTGPPCPRGRRHGPEPPPSPPAAPAQPKASTSGAAGEAPARGEERVNIFEDRAAASSQRTWDLMVRWGARLKSQAEVEAEADDFIVNLRKVVVFGGGSFATAMACALARKYPGVSVVMLLRDPAVCLGINRDHVNPKYLTEFELPANLAATVSTGEALEGAQLAVHAVPVQHSRRFLEGVRGALPADVPIVCLSKGLEVESGLTMDGVIPQALGRAQPCAFLSGPSFAREVMEQRPTAMAVASADTTLLGRVQRLFGSPCMRVSSTTDVTGVELAGALKNVLAIAAGIVDGMELGLNATAAVIAQGASEIRWLAERMGANPATVAGISGLGDIMLTCYGSLSRNRTVGLRLGRGEQLEDILGSTSQVAEGVATARVVSKLAYQYRVQLPVLTAVAQILDGNISPREAMLAIMELPQMPLH